MNELETADNASSRIPAQLMLKVTLDVKQVAALVGVSTACIYNMVRENQIPFVRVRKRVLFHREKVEAWLKGA